jgi:hypothetical protein
LVWKQKKVNIISLVVLRGTPEYHWCDSGVPVDWSTSRT